MKRLFRDVIYAIQDFLETFGASQIFFVRLLAGIPSALARPGLIIKQVHAAAGEAVDADAPLIVMEAMKMELTLSAPRAGIIAEMLVSEGDQVADGDLLLQLESDAE